MRKLISFRDNKLAIDVSTGDVYAHVSVVASVVSKTVDELKQIMLDSFIDVEVYNVDDKLALLLSPSKIEKLVKLCK